MEEGRGEGYFDPRGREQHDKIVEVTSSTNRDGKSISLLCHVIIISYYGVRWMSSFIFSLPFDQSRPLPVSIKTWFFGIFVCKRGTYGGTFRELKIGGTNKPCLCGISGSQKWQYKHFFMARSSENMFSSSVPCQIVSFAKACCKFVKFRFQWILGSMEEKRARTFY